MRIFLAVLLFLGFAPALAASADELDALFAEYWEYELAESPFGATYSGRYDRGAEMPQVAPEDYERRTQARKAFLARLDAIDVAAAPEDARLSADLLRFILKHDVALAAFDEWRVPFLADTGFHTDIVYVVGATPFRSKSDYEMYLERLRALPGYIDQNIANMRQGLADGVTQPKEILPFIMPSFAAQVTETAEAHPLYGPFEAMPASISKRDQARIRKDGAAAISEAVIPAYARLLAFMEDDYLPGARGTIGVSATPGGEDHYRALVRYYTTRDDATPEDIHALGLKEVARIRKEMDSVIKETGFKGTFDEFTDFLRNDPQFYAKTPEQLLQFAAWVSKDADGKLPAFFGKLPRQPYSVEPVPAAIAENYTTGRYISAPKDGDRGGQYWVNTSSLDKRPLYQIPALTLHEAVPGHHLQGALSLEIENVPEFRTQFYPHAFGEGWGLYSEKLGIEMDIYQTPYEHFGRLSYEMWRACRLVIDTGVHLKGWSRQQALDYLAGNTALSLKNVQTEVDRYIAWPGQALAYKIGELTIWELRARAEKELGDEFDIREFHDALLAQGGLPMDMLSDQVDRYIADVKAR